MGLQRALQDGRFLGGGWSHTSPGAGGTVNLATDASGRSIVAGLTPGSTFRVELVDCLDQVVVTRNIDRLPSDGATVDLTTGWERHIAELSLAVRWADGEPVVKGSVHVKANAGRSRSFLFTDGLVRLAPMTLSLIHI